MDNEYTQKDWMSHIIIIATMLLSLTQSTDISIFVCLQLQLDVWCMESPYLQECPTHSSVSTVTALVMTSLYARPSHAKQSLPVELRLSFMNPSDQLRNASFAFFSYVHVHTSHTFNYLSFNVV